MARLRTIVAVVFLCVSVCARSVGAQPQGIDTQHSTMTVRVFKSGLFRAFADNHVIRAPIARGSVDDSGAPRVELVVDARDMRVLDPGLSPKDRADVQARMLGPDVLDASRFPEIAFHSTAVQRLDGDRWLVRGDLALHGEVREVSVKVARQNGRYGGSATLRQTDFAIAPISIAGGTVKVKDEVTIEFDVVTIERR